MASFYYQTEVSHKGLNKYRVVKAQSKYELQKKVEALKAQWDEQWKRKVLQEEKRLEMLSAFLLFEICMEQLLTKARQRGFWSQHQTTEMTRIPLLKINQSPC